jgi:Cys-rich protein (TIGR01571 family)
MFATPGVASGGNLNLDTPINNFDIAGIPTNGDFSSPLWGCFENVVPSCVLSFFCPCIMFGQVVVRAQIPLCIDIKNSFTCLSRRSGYSFFIDIYLYTGLVSLALLLVLVSQAEQIKNATSNAFYVVLWGFDVILIWLFLYYNAHIRMAVREKYHLNTNFFRSRGIAEWTIDSAVATLCLPCSLAQLARHVFQYDKWEPQIGLFQGDPSGLPPLEAVVHRPDRADQAGLSIMSNRMNADGRGNISQPSGTAAANANYPVATSAVVGRGGDIETGTAVYATGPATTTGSAHSAVPVAKSVR